MEIKPVKNYKKPKYAVSLAAVVACVSAVTGCSEQLSGIAPASADGAGAQSTAVNTTLSGTYATTEDVQLAGDEAVYIETTTSKELPTVGLVAVTSDDMTVTTTRPITTTTEAVETTEETLGGAVAVETEVQLEGAESLYTDITTSEESVALDGDVAVNVLDMPEDELWSLCGATVLNGFREAGIDDLEMTYDNCVDYCDRTDVTVYFASQKAKLLISIYCSYNGCETDGSICTVLGDRTGNGIADKFGYGYIDKATYDGDECTIVFIDAAAHPTLEKTDVADIIDELLTRKII